MKTFKQAITTTLLFLFFLNSLDAQKAPMKWGKVPKKDLTMETYQLDSEAEAVVLCDFGDLEFDFSTGDTKYIMKRHKRIKILKEAGFDQADISIPYYGFENMEKVVGIDAQVINPDGSKQSIKNKEVFTEARNRYWSIKKFTIPGIQVGSIIEYRYTIESEFIFTLPEWYYQEKIPVRHSELRLRIPEWYDYLILNQGLVLTNSEKSSTTANLMVPGIRERTTQTINSSVTSISQSGYDQVEAQIINSRFVMENAPALRSEAYITSMNNYYSRMRFQLRGVNFPNKPYRPLMGDWQQVYREMMESESFGLQFTRKGKYKKALAETDELTDQAETPQEKMILLYNYISQNFQWNGIYGTSVDKSLNDCFEKKAGNSAELNLLLLALLKANDIEAYPMLISTRTNGYSMQVYPILEQFNHVLVLAQIEGNTFVLDVHDPAYPINFPRENALNGSAWLMAEQPQWVNLTASLGKSTILGNFELSSTGDVKGKVRGKFEGYDAIDERQAFRSNKSGKHWEDRLTAIYPDAQITKVETAKLETPAKPLGLKIECEIPDMAQIAGDFLYLPSLGIPIVDENPLKSEKRQFPVEMMHPISKKYIFNYITPEEYAVEELPEPAIVTLPNNGGEIRYQASDAGGKIQVLLQLEINQTFYTPEEYDYIRSFFNLLIEKQNEQIILKKRT